MNRSFYRYAHILEIYKNFAICVANIYLSLSFIFILIHSTCIWRMNLKFYKVKLINTAAAASFPGVMVIKNLPANAGDMRETGSTPRSERPPGEGKSNPVQYPCLESLMDRGAWRAVVHGVGHERATEHTHSCCQRPTCAEDSLSAILCDHRGCCVSQLMTCTYIDLSSGSRHDTSTRTPSMRIFKSSRGTFIPTFRQKFQILKSSFH